MFYDFVTDARSRALHSAGAYILLLRHSVTTAFSKVARIVSWYHGCRCTLRFCTQKQQPTKYIIVLCLVIPVSITPTASIGFLVIYIHTSIPMVMIKSLLVPKITVATFVSAHSPSIDARSGAGATNINRIIFIQTNLPSLRKIQ